MLLSECDGCDGIQVVIGAWGNQKSALRDKFHGTTLVTKDHIPLSEAEFRSFWINAVTKEDGSLEVSKEYYKYKR